MENKEEQMICHICGCSATEDNWVVGFPQGKKTCERCHQTRIQSETPKQKSTYIMTQRDNRKERQYVYKCRMCGKRKGGAIGVFSTTDALNVFMELERKPGTVYRTGAVIGITDFHFCDNGDFGITDLIGVRDFDPTNQ